MKQLIKKTIERLKKEKLKPLPKWRFVLVDVAYWMLVSLAVLFSAVALAVGIFLFFQIDWNTLRYVRSGSLGIFFLYIPYAWFAILAFLMVAVFYFIRKTKEGYRYKWIVILFSFLSLVAVLGTGAHFARIGKIADDFAYRRIPLYENFAPNMEHMWQRSADGFLAGEVSSVGRDRMTIIDLSGKKWEVFISDKTFLGGPIRIEAGSFVKIIGEDQGGNVFEADTIISGRGMMRGFDERGMGGARGMMRGGGYR